MAREDATNAIWHDPSSYDYLRHGPPYLKTASVPDLGGLLAYLRALAFMYQTYHWRCKGSPFFSDHLLFERLYNDVLKDIDALAERIAGIENESSLDPIEQATRMQAYLTEICAPSQDGDAETALRAEDRFNTMVDAVAASIDATRGTDNLLAGLQDRHEANMYLLKQRTQPDDYGR